MRWWKGISTGIAWDRPIDEVLPVIARTGFKVIEVATARSHLDIESAAVVRETARHARDLGLRVRSIHAPFGDDVDFTDPSARVRERSLDRLERAAEALAILAGRIYVVHPGGEHDRWEDERQARLARSVEGLRHLWEICQSLGLVLAIETPLPHLLGGRLEDLDAILTQLPEAGTGVCLDTSHASLGGTLLDVPQRYGARLVHVQASDNRGRNDDHLPPGEGILPWDRIVASLEDAGYDGTFLLEVGGRASPAEDVGRAAERLRALCPEGVAAPEGMLGDCLELDQPPDPCGHVDIRSLRGR